MAHVLLDSDAIIDYVEGVPGSVSLIQSLDGQGDRLCTCDVIIAEIYSGLKPKDRDKAERLLESLHFLATSADAARQAGEWRYEYARRGVALATSDVLIAATAYAHQASVLTANLKDYPMPEIRILALPRPNPKSIS